jgi:hypothetical protein
MITITPLFKICQFSRAAAVLDRNNMCNGSTRLFLEIFRIIVEFGIRLLTNNGKSLLQSELSGYLQGVSPHRVPRLFMKLRPR